MGLVLYTMLKETMLSIMINKIIILIVNNNYEKIMSDKH
jgi:hypothetical protein